MLNKMKMHPLKEQIKENLLNDAEKYIYDKLMDYLNRYTIIKHNAYWKFNYMKNFSCFIDVKLNCKILLLNIVDNIELNNIRQCSKNSWKNSTKSPIKQILELGKDIYLNSSPELIKHYLDNNQNNSDFITHVVYFHNINKEYLIEIEKELNNVFDNVSKRPKWLTSEVRLICREDIENNNKLLIELCNVRSEISKDKIYEDVVNYLNNDKKIEIENKDLPIELNKQQKDLCISKDEYIIIKGPARCGKTTVLIERAINAFYRTNEPVIILTFNITLVNYIKEQLAKNKRYKEYLGDFIKVTYYYNFIYNAYNNISIDFDLKNCDKKIIVKMNDNKCYRTILVDETQDFTSIMKNNILAFARSDGEVVFFENSQQNIYKIDKTDELTYIKEKRLLYMPEDNTKMLNEKSYLKNDYIKELANDFQKIFLSAKYNIENIPLNKYNSELTRMMKNLGNKIEYHYDMDNYDIKNIAYTIIEIFKKVDMKNCCIISDRCLNLIILDYYLKNIKQIETSTRTFETLEEYEKYIEPLLCENIRVVSRAKQLLRRPYKQSFRTHTDDLKMSTIHSFKGWEMKNIIIILSSFKKTMNGNEIEDINELLYTAITRCIKNLYIINCENKFYHDFFINKIEHCKCIKDIGASLPNIEDFVKIKIADIDRDLTDTFPHING